MTITNASPLAETAARGIRKSEWIKSGGAGKRFVTAQVFMRDKRDTARPDRGDGMIELSIDFIDHDDVLPKLLSRTTASPNGAVVFRPLQANSVPLREEHRTLYNFERCEEDGNIHHGHLLLHTDLPPDVELAIATALALYAEVHTR